MWLRSQKKQLLKKEAFSLIEVALAIGIVAFSMVLILGLLPVGLRSVQDSTAQLGIATITQQLRADVGQAAFSTITSDLSGQTKFYTQDGLLTNQVSAYFSVGFSVLNPSGTSAASGYLPGASATMGQSAQLVQVTIRYPNAAPASSQKKNVFVLLCAKQSND